MTTNLLHVARKNRINALTMLDQRIHNVFLRYDACPPREKRGKAAFFISTRAKETQSEETGSNVVRLVA